jgi:hypothetical protein
MRDGVRRAITALEDSFEDQRLIAALESRGLAVTDAALTEGEGAQLPAVRSKLVALFEEPIRIDLAAACEGGEPTVEGVVGACRIRTRVASSQRFDQHLAGLINRALAHQGIDARLTALGLDPVCEPEAWMVASDEERAQLEEAGASLSVPEPVFEVREEAGPPRLFEARPFWSPWDPGALKPEIAAWAASLSSRLAGEEEVPLGNLFRFRRGRTVDGASVTLGFRAEDCNEVVEGAVAYQGEPAWGPAVLEALRGEYDAVELPGVGWIIKNQLEGYEGRNPRTGEVIRVPGKTVLRFKAS